MGWLTKYGTQWGDVPQTTGSVFWVAPASPYTVEGRSYSSSDNNDGLSPERALATIGQAISNATANNGDIIMLLPGSHTNAAVVSINKAGLTFIGAHPRARFSPDFRPYPLDSKVNWTSTLAGAAVALTVADTTFAGINMIPVTAQSFMTAVTCPRTAFIDCAVTLSAAASTSTKGIVFSGGSSAFCSFTNCIGINTIATSAQGPWLDLTGAANFAMESCQTLLTGTSSAWAVAIQLGAGSSGVVKNSHIAAQGAGTITIGVDGTGVAVANSVMFSNNFYGVSPGAGAVKNLTNADAGIVQNFYATIGGGAGFVIQTVTT